MMPGTGMEGGAVAVKEMGGSRTEEQWTRFHAPVIPREGPFFVLLP